MKQRPPKARFMKKVAGVDPTSRADFGKAHVIISEKRDKKAGKYLVKDLPYPYTSAAQFERRMEQPLGVEWNTRIGFQRGTLPKVVKKVSNISIHDTGANIHQDGDYHRSTGETILTVSDGVSLLTYYCTIPLLRVD